MRLRWAAEQRDGTESRCEKRPSERTDDATFGPMDTKTEFDRLSHIYRHIDDCIRGLEANWPIRWRRWLRALPGDGTPNPLSFVTHVIFDAGELDPANPGVALGPRCLAWMVEADDDPWTQVAFLTSYGELPSPATLIGFEWFDVTPFDRERLEPIVERLYSCLRALAPALTIAEAAKHESNVPGA